MQVYVCSMQNTAEGLRRPERLWFCIFFLNCSLELFVEFQVILSMYDSLIRSFLVLWNLEGIEIAPWIYIADQRKLNMPNLSNQE